MEVVGIMEIGHQSLDSSLVIVTLRRMQELYGLGEGVGFVMKIDDGLRSGSEHAVIFAIGTISHGRLPGRGWMRTDFLFVVQLEKNANDVLLAHFIIVVAAYQSRVRCADRRGAEDPRDRFTRGNRRAHDVALCFCWQA